MDCNRLLMNNALMTFKAFITSRTDTESVVYAS